MEMIIRNKGLEADMPHKSPTIVSERYKKVSNPISVQKETEIQDGEGKQMCLDGDITKTEYNEEISKREM